MQNAMQCNAMQPKQYNTTVFSMGRMSMWCVQIKLFVYMTRKHACPIIPVQVVVHFVLYFLWSDKRKYE